MRVMTHPHKLENGPLQVNNYGIELARKTGLCQSITEQANEIAMSELSEKFIQRVSWF